MSSLQNLSVKDDIHFISRLVPFLITCSTESIECFIEDRRMIRLLAHPFPTSLVSKLSLFLSLPVCRRSSFLTEGGGEGEEPNLVVTLLENNWFVCQFRHLHRSIAL
jgi:hypothetical protein